MDINLGFTVHLPADVSFLKTMSFVLVFSLAVFLICLLAKLLLGKDSSLKFAINSALSMIMLYTMCIVIYSLSPRDFSHYLNRMAMGSFGVSEDGEKVFVLNTLRGLELPALSYQVLRIFLLAWMINYLSTITPANLKFLGWVLWRLFMLLVAVIINYAFYKLVDMFVPFVFKQYAPMIVLGILLFSYALGFIKYLVGAVLTIVNPVFIAFYVFFFTTKSGKHISRAVGSTIVLCILVGVFETLGYGVLPIGPAVLDAYIPFGLSMFILWIIVGRVL